MAYADQSVSGNRVVALIIVAIIHLVVGYVLVTGLAYNSIKKAIERVTTIDVEEPPPPEDTPPPPPPKNVPPPPVAPPPPISIAVAPPPIRVQQEIPPVQQPVIRIVPTAAPPPPKPVQPFPEPRGRPQSWVTDNDYPSRAIREEEQGTTRFSVTVGTDGRVQNCQVTGSSGFADLDQAVCRLITSRARFNPAKDSEGNPMTGSWSSSFRWQIPKD
jgi:protein TonB